MQILLVSALFTLNINPAVEVEFPTEKGKTYQVQRTWNMEDPSWEDVKDPVAGTGEPHSIFVREEKTHAFFRVVTVDSAQKPQAPNPPGHSDSEEDKDNGDDEEQNDNESANHFTGFMKVHHDAPIGPVMHEGSGILDAARFSAETLPNLDVKAVEILIKD